MRLTSIRRRWRRRPEIFRRRWSVATPVGLHPSYVATDHRRFLTTNPGGTPLIIRGKLFRQPRPALSSPMPSKKGRPFPRPIREVLLIALSPPRNFRNAFGSKAPTLEHRSNYRLARSRALARARPPHPRAPPRDSQATKGYAAARIGSSLPCPGQIASPAGDARPNHKARSRDRDARALPRCRR